MTKEEKQKLLQSEFGEKLQIILRKYYITSYLDSFSENEIQYGDLLDLCLAALEFMYGDKFGVEFNTDYYQLINKDTGEIIIKGIVEVTDVRNCRYEICQIDNIEQEPEITQLNDQSLINIFNEHYENLKQTPGSAMVFWKENEVWKGLFLNPPDTYVLYQEKLDILQKLKNIQKLDANAINVKDFEFQNIHNDEFRNVDKAMDIPKHNYGTKNSSIVHIIKKYENYLEQAILPEKYTLLEQSNFGKNLVHFAEKYNLALKTRDEKLRLYYTDLWNVYKEALEFIYHREFVFVHEPHYYGIRPLANLYKSIWLLKVEQYYDADKSIMQKEIKFDFKKAEEKAEKLYNFLKEMHL